VASLRGHGGCSSASVLNTRFVCPASAAADGCSPIGGLPGLPVPGAKADVLCSDSTCLLLQEDDETDMPPQAMVRRRV
jgi:hypothetical protein